MSVQNTVQQMKRKVLIMLIFEIQYYYHDYSGTRDLRDDIKRGFQVKDLGRLAYKSCLQQFPKAFPGGPRWDPGKVELCFICKTVVYRGPQQTLKNIFFFK